MSTSIRKTHCRICQASCGLKVHLDGGRISRIEGDAEHPLSKGYTCIKGRQWSHQVSSAHRLKQYRRGRAGSSRGSITIPREQALDEIAARLKDIIARDGPRAVAAYTGTGTQLASAGTGFVEAWLEGLGSTMHFTSMTIDQPSKGIGAEWHGLWGAGPTPFSAADVVMLIGNNPVVSALSWPGGPPQWYPSAIGQSKKAGKRYIVIDPRVTETARHADIHLQLLPGQDATLLAGMIRIILTERLYDTAFCDVHTVGIDALRAAVDQFSPSRAAGAAGVPVEQLIAAARLFATGGMSVATSATGPAMAPHANLSEYLRLCLNSLCGSWVKAGERIATPNVLFPDFPPPAQALPKHLLPKPYNPEANTEKTRIGMVRRVHGEMPTPVLPDEILMPGDGQVKALIVIGGNPMAAFPDRQKTERALDALELLVCIDIVETETTRKADFVLPAAHPLEREDCHWTASMFAEEPYGGYSKALLEPPEDVVDEWQLLWGLANRMGSNITLAGGELDMVTMPSTLDVLQLKWPASKIRIEQMRDQESGRFYEQYADIRASTPIPGSSERLQLAAPEALKALQLLEVELKMAGTRPKTRFTHLLACRRAKNVNNSMCHDFPGRRAHSPIYIHPADAESLNFSEGQRVEVESENGKIVAAVCLDESMRRGVVSMHHCFGSMPGAEGDPVKSAATRVSELISTTENCDSITGMARQSAIPVRFSAVSA